MALERSWQLTMLDKQPKIRSQDRHNSHGSKDSIDSCLMQWVQTEAAESHQDPKDQEEVHHPEDPMVEDPMVTVPRPKTAMA